MKIIGGLTHEEQVTYWRDTVRGELVAEIEQLRAMLRRDRNDLGFAGKALRPAIEAGLMPGEPRCLGIPDSALEQSAAPGGLPSLDKSLHTPEVVAALQKPAMKLRDDADEQEGPSK